jgi:2-keto-4-pentenoate hydratase/2-oxohepta-3-ene-1,7-dioic acid hydratase in catechol pathway
MSINVLRTDEGWWVQHDGKAAAIDTAARTTAELLADRPTVDAAAAEQTGLVDVSELDLLSPVTTPARVVAQMVNYRSHAKDSGFDPAKVTTTFFRKASGSVSGPNDTIVTPKHVRLLDYEVELGLVIGSPLALGSHVHEEDLSRYVAGFVVTNDVSARDVQLSKGQFYESKSYPTFTPVGPRLTLVDSADLRSFGDLRLQLWVNGVLRQDSTTADMIARPAEALTQLARFQTLSPGDLLLTGTPGGTALKAPPALVTKFAGLLPESAKWKLFFKGQAANPAYLKAGDVVTACIATPDGAIDLGMQRTAVK